MPCEGDLVEVFPTVGNAAAIALADVCGRDARARGHAGFLRHAIRALADQCTPGRLLKTLNTAFYNYATRWDDDRFASMFLATLQGTHLTYASAGHDLALLVGGDGRHRHLPSTGMVLGIRDGECYQERIVRLMPGDWLVLVSDGVTDTRDPFGTFFGTSGVVRSVLRATSDADTDLAACILEAARSHGAGSFMDDASVLCVTKA